MSQLIGATVSLQLVRPHRYRVHYYIFLQDQPIGEIELDHIAWRSGEAELKIEIFKKEMQGRGYGSDAIITLLKQAFFGMNLNRVYLRVQAKNKSALRCYEKAGFKKEGRLNRTIEGNVEEEIYLMGISKIQFAKDKRSLAI